MTADKRRAAREIYLVARSLPAAEQAQHVDRECADDNVLRKEVQVMLDSVIDLPSVSSGLPSMPMPSSGNSPSSGARAQNRRIEKLSEQSNTSSRYELQEEIGRGGQGAILKVFDNDLRRTLAMKVILQRAGAGSGDSSQVDSGLLARFLEEAQITGQLDHPGVIPVHELGVDSDGRVYFTMRLVKGRELRQIIRLVHDGDSEWTLTRSLGVLLKVCETMAYAHDKGIVHRDLKPANVMVGKYGEVYVMDWGLARVAGREDSRDIRLQHSIEFSLTVVETDRKQAKDESMNSPLVTMDGAVVGTPFYMPPEQAAGRIEEVDARSDVYAVGAMLYHLLTGRMPYYTPGDRPSPHTVLALVLQGPPTPLHDLAPDTPAELEAICDKAMARERSERYADMGELGEDLRAFMEGRVVHAYRSGALAEFRKWVGRNRGMAASLAAAVLILLIGLVSSSLLYVDARTNAEAAVRQSYVAGILAADISF
ncbi:MAG: serine/threonine-protein kinase, partial [Planctomycetota bacterium]